MIGTAIFEKGDYAWYMFGRDPKSLDSVIDTNEYLIINGDDYLLMDPGGTEIFPAVISALSEVIDISKLKNFFCSHQDPDIMSSMPLWMGLCPEAKIYLPRFWAGYIAHFGHEYVDNFIKVPDGGMSIPMGNKMEDLQLIPAHYCHSSGNFSLYDPNAKILFSGDIGAAVLPDHTADIEVQDFQSHLKYMEPVHQRWMPSSEALGAWVSRVRALDVDMICPQHGAFITGENIPLFLDWLENLEVGISCMK